jgi:hypothetical protein
MADVMIGRQANRFESGRQTDHVCYTVSVGDHFRNHQGEQDALCLDAAEVSAHAAIRANHAVTRHHDRKRVGSTNTAHSADGLRVAGQLRHRGVGRRVAVADLEQMVQRNPADRRQSSGTSKPCRCPAKYSSSSRETVSSRAGAFRMRGLMRSDRDCKTVSWFSLAYATRTSPASVAASSSKPTGCRRCGTRRRGCLPPVRRRRVEPGVNADAQVWPRRPRARSRSRSLFVFIGILLS